MATSEPMTTERIYEIDALWVFLDETEVDEAQDALRELLIEVRRLRAREQALAAADEDADETLVQAVQEMKRLKDENTRLRAENAAMRPVVALVARGCVDEATIGFPEFIVALDGDDSVSEMANAESLIEQARAFIAAHPATTAAGEVESEGE